MKNKKLKIKLKYIIALSIIAIAFLGFTFDYFWAKTYNIEIVNISNPTPYADSKERVTIDVKVTHFNNPCKNHEIYALPSAGSMVAYTTKTDENGWATLTYTLYTKTAFVKLEDVKIVIRDQSNSIFWEINAKTSLTLKMVEKPKG